MRYFKSYKIVFTFISVVIFFIYNSFSLKTTEGIFVASNNKPFDQIVSNNVIENHYVNVYSSLNNKALKLIFKKFTEKTGIKVNALYKDSDSLISMLESQGSFTKIDLLILSDFLSLQKAKEKNILKPLVVKNLFKNIPSKFRDLDNKWFGIAYDPILVAYSKNKYNEQDFPTYESLSDKKFKGYILKNRNAIGNKNKLFQVLLSYMSYNKGIENSSSFVSKLFSNYANIAPLTESDGINYLVNGNLGVLFLGASDYFDAVSESKKDLERKLVLSKVGIAMPRVLYANLSGAGVVFSSKNQSNAISLLEFISSTKMQELYTLKSNNYPVSVSAKIPKLLNVIKEQKIFKNFSYDISKYFKDIEKLY